jgi:hypothetical protein
LSRKLRKGVTLKINQEAVGEIRAMAHSICG